MVKPAGVPAAAPRPRSNHNGAHKGAEQYMTTRVHRSARSTKAANARAEAAPVEAAPERAIDVAQPSPGD